ncbi:uncharacterized protein TrAtP1_004259 [Trichoderma atroviride]|uniref:HMG box domain-containing protein n=1 Tax=Hypocrea atroviridis (strain ATCC 20476 / IMI 206040) TaxID=452589 RepID=G9P838_HYPAI|nr:uncharacterized protein TRIATDRAFT_321166 [Trichoderma atroviride IMI 206040]EHK40887.1 hypothetical protein TRIATDRAFT_321166 [Trichoderma atroviride IMI 206040]UKZ63031.1 hypothetical protein TrAtP1_004259 [Trichoderma atroviride]
MNQDLETVFRELGIAQYLDTFVEQGFDTWDTILDIQESDLDALGVKLGHRRRLQRRIANARGIDPSISLSTLKAAIEEGKHDGTYKKREPGHNGDGSSGPKRKYRRHPKPDENAPERPMSAYVLFSNRLRESLKGDRSLTFTEIAKLVGEHWQNLSLPEREVYEGQARQSKERYYREMAVYKETPEYRKYMKYLDEFNDKQSKPGQRHEDAKRARLEQHELMHDHNGSGSSIVSGSTVLGGSTSTASGNSSVRTQDSESRESPNPRQNSVHSILSGPESHHPSIAPIPSPASAYFEVDNPKRISNSGHLRQGSSSIRGAAQMMPHQADMPQQQQQHLPSLSDMLSSRQGRLDAPGIETVELPHAFATHHRPSASQGEHALPPVAVSSLHHESSSSASSVPTIASSRGSRRLSEGPLAIHALLADQTQTSHRRDEGPLYTSSYVASPVDRGISAFGHYQGPKGYGFQTASSALQNMRVEETSDGDVLMTSADEPISIPHTYEATGLDGVNALLKAGELFDDRRS